MQDAEINCWEFKNCGREPGGIKSSELGVCPVSTHNELDGIHSGTNGGRCCWIFYGAFSCRGEEAKSFDEHIAICRTCDFYIKACESEEILVVL
ncbi:MAG: two-CW domain-containing protein [Candidatus Electrothrix aestuarii]|uniref:Two-CW domain-containing protein n=1 Tax=Candidatus Electrothrix aestuarii TaxID=3062594 RepID=A0AAU8LVT4_9BACT